MATRIVEISRRPTPIPFFEIGVMTLVFVIFLALLNKYFVNGFISSVDIASVQAQLTQWQEDLHEDVQPTCADTDVTLRVYGGTLCRATIPNEELPNYSWLSVYDTYPKSNNGGEIIYDFLDTGDIAIADGYLRNEYGVERYEPVLLQEIVWDEDPYNENYWRFLFYSLRETRHLLYAYRETGDIRYKDKLVEILEGFIDDGMGKPIAWEDYHAVAYRAMVLTNTWWKLREKDALTPELSEKILTAIQLHGTFLLDAAHYQNEHNHGLSEATALWLLGLNFPDAVGAHEWASVGEERITSSIDTLVDTDGVLVENSPYYHMYALEKYWSILQYCKRYGITMDAKLEQKVNQMIAYATHILQPDLRVPMMGASVERKIGNAGVFKEIGKKNPEFLYVITNGKEGKEPTSRNKYYTTTGQVIMRSGWGKKTKFDNSFVNQTQVVFDVGPYRTDHSDLDAFSFNLFSNGKVLVGDTGLYTYEYDNNLKKYFHGTVGHNTVVVDGKDQRSGSPAPGEFKEGDDYAYYVAQHSLYPQTYHQRGIALLGHDIVVVVDRLLSNNEHDYEQLFHTFPNAKTTIENDTAVVRDTEEKNVLTIHQLQGGGEITVRDKLCSFEYEKAEVCPTVVTKKHATTTEFISVLEIGDSRTFVSAQVAGDVITIVTKEKTYQIDLGGNDVAYVDGTKKTEQILAEYQLGLSVTSDRVHIFGEGSERFKARNLGDGKVTIVPVTLDDNPIYAERPTYTVTIPEVGTYYSINQKTTTDIPFDMHATSFKVYEQEDFLPILGYHRIIPNNQKIEHPTLEIHVSDFEEQIAHMTTVAGCRWYTLGDIVENYIRKEEKVPQRACVMNFDDGRMDQFTNGYRIFKNYGAVASFYIIAERAFGNNETYMSLNELDELYRNGNEIGSHTINSSSLLEGGYDETGLLSQLEESKKMLESQGYAVTTFAYPRGDQDDHIVELTKEFYHAGRDTLKDNSWRDRRPVTAGFGDDFLWHMHYFKPELLNARELAKAIGYNTWWQFEEGYRLDAAKSAPLRTLTSYDPTETSYGGVVLASIGDAISNKFIVAKDGEYTIEVYGTVRTEGVSSFGVGKTMHIAVDGEVRGLREGPPSNECMVYENEYYCYYEMTVYLSQGVHVLSVTALQEDVKVDKFRMYRGVQTKNVYTLQVVESVQVAPKMYPGLFTMNVSTSYTVWESIQTLFVRVFHMLTFT